jgi:CheY-like chemotaxis protein
MADQVQKKILIVEDDRFLSLVLKGRLDKEGFLVSQAFDGAEGLTMVRQDKPDLIILDLIMPKMSGFEFLEAVSIDPQLSQIPVVVASNLGQESDIAKAKSLGVANYYVKVRTSVDDLVKILKNLVSKEPQPQAQPQ